MEKYFIKYAKAALSMLLIAAMLMPYATGVEIQIPILSKQEYFVEAPTDSKIAESVLPQTESLSESTYNSIRYDSNGNVTAVEIAEASPNISEELCKLFGDLPSTRAKSAVDDTLTETYGLTAQEIEQGAMLHGDKNALISQLSAYTVATGDSQLSAEASAAVVSLICSGYTSSQAMAAYVTGQVLDISVVELAQARKEEIILTLSADIDNEDYLNGETVEEDTELLELSVSVGIPYALLEQAVQDGERGLGVIREDFTTRWDEIYAPLLAGERSNTKAQSSGSIPYTPETVLEKPYSYDAVDNLEINLNNGSYFYKESDLTIPGKNGLDLNITRIFDSNNAWITRPVGYYDDGYANSLAFAVGMRCYILEVPYNMAGKLIPDSELVRYQANDPGYNELIHTKWEFIANDFQDVADLKEALKLEFVGTIFSAEDPYGDTIILRAEPVVYALPGFENAFLNLSTKDETLNNEFGLGNGWRLGFSSIISYYERFGVEATNALITSDGRKHIIEQNGGNNLRDYKLSDIRFEYSGNGYPGAKYTLAHLDGKKEYFDAKGRNIAIVDRFGNKITLQYTYEDSSQDVVSKISIVDTVGNNIVYQNEHLDPSLSYYANGKLNQMAWKYNVKWTLTLNGTLVTTYYSNNTSSGRTLVCVSNATDEYTQYRSTTMSRKYNCFISSPSRNDGTSKRVGLNLINYPNGHTLWLSGSSLSKKNERIDQNGYQESARTTSVSETYEEAGTEYTTKMREYTFGDYSYFYTPYSNTVDYQTKLELRHRKQMDVSPSYVWPGQVTTYTFNVEQYKYLESTQIYTPVQESQVNHDTFNALMQNHSARRAFETRYSYDARDLPTEMSTQYYNTAGSSVRSAVNKYTYNDYGNILSETKPNGQTIQYTYSSDYQLPLTTTYKQNSEHTIMVTNTLTADKKAVATQEIKDNNAIAGKTEFSYDASGRVINQKLYRGETDFISQSFDYGTSAKAVERRVTGVLDANGMPAAGTPGFTSGEIATRTGYDQFGRETALTDENGGVTRIGYDAAGRVASVTAPGGEQATYTYNTQASTVTYTDEGGTQYIYRYRPTGELEQVALADSGQILRTMDYDSYGRLTLETDYTDSSHGRSVYYYYDELDRVIEQGQHNADGSLTPLEKYAYENIADGEKKTHTILGGSGVPDQIETEYTDKMGNTVKTGRMLNGTEYADTFTYDFLGNCIESKTAYTASLGGAFTTRTAYDWAGRPTAVTNALNQTVAYAYNWLGNCLSATDAKGVSTVSAYDALGRLVSLSQPFEDNAAAITKYFYDAKGNVIRRDTANSKPGEALTWATVSYAYNTNNRLTQVASKVSGSAVNYTQYYYDAMGNPLRMYTGLTAPLTITGLDAVSGGSGDYATTKYTYDQFGNQLTMTDPLNQTEHTAYDLTGAPTSQTDRNGNVTTYSYDEQGRLTRNAVVTSGGKGDETLSYTYAPNGAKLSESGGTGTTTFRYDGLGRMTEERSGDTVKTYAYNPSGLRTGFILKVGGVEKLNSTYRYDALGRLFQVTDGAVSAQYGYDVNGNRSYVQYGNGLREEYAYNQANLVTQVANKKGSTVLSRYDYAYILDGNQSSKTELDGTKTTYTYDGLGQLLSESASRGDGTANARVYTYDSRNNRASMVTRGAENLRVDYAYDKANRLVTAMGTPAGGAAETTTYTYDHNGNRLSAASPGLDGMVSYRYDGFNRQTGVTGGGRTSTYTYGPGGLRTGKTVGGVTTSYVWDGQEIVLEQGSTATKYLRGLNLIAGVGSTTNYYLYNAHGDVVQLTDQTGAVTREYKYDAFGVELNPGAGDMNPFRYCGEQYDSETGSIYLRARYYDVQNGRFTSEDSVRARRTNLFDPYGDYQSTTLEGGVYVDWEEQQYVVDDPLSLNLYTYVGNNPVNYTDPSGNIAIADDIFIAFVFAAGVSVYKASSDWLASPDGQRFVRGCTAIIVDGITYTGNALGNMIDSLISWGQQGASITSAKAGDGISEHTKLNGSKKKSNNKHTKPRPGRANEGKKLKPGWKPRNP